MSVPPPDELTNFVDEPSPSLRPDPASYVLRWPWYYPALLGGSGLLFGALYAAATSVPGLLLLAIVGTLTGVVLTLLATAWGVAIVFADDTRSGLWFVIFPPYMVVYAVRRWKWMAQPSVMFLCGLALAFGSLIAVQRLTPSVVGRPTSESHFASDSSVG